MDSSFVVRNYPLMPLTDEEKENLQTVKAERELDLQVRELTQDITGDQCLGTSVTGGGPMTSDGTLGIPATPSARISSAKGGSYRSNSPKTSRTVDLIYSKAYQRFHGSRSYEFLDIKQFLLLHQLEVTTRRQIRQQIVLLKVSLIVLSGLKIN